MSQIFPSNRTKTLIAPTQPQPYSEKYVPVDCDFTDDLEFASVARVQLEITHETEDESTVVDIGSIVDIVTEVSKQEFAVLQNGTRIRLDRIRRLQILD
jgi:transcriptional antiterminator Rof (Rho-off)